MGVTGMSDFEISCQEFDRSVLTAILKAVSPSPHKAADDILNRFPSFQHAARADHTALAEVIGNAGARLLRTIPDAVASMTRETAINAASYILTIEAAIVHFGALLNGRRNEALAVVYLNANNRLIGEDLWEGALDRAFIYPREITRRANEARGDSGAGGGVQRIIGLVFTMSAFPFKADIKRCLILGDFKTLVQFLFWDKS